VLRIKTVTFLAVLLSLVVITLGAYTRLTDAGLGCPDWPGCYGHMGVPESEALITQAEMAFPERPVEPEKAWNEMIHRYFAGTLGLLVAVIFFMSLANRRNGAPIGLPGFLLLLVCFQAALGMWTVTMKLMPIVVMGHLLGGFATLSCLYLLSLRLKGSIGIGGHKITSQLTVESNSRLREFSSYATLGVAILVLQIALGGWTSSNYAAMVCTELPICQSGWLEQLTFENSFNPIPPERDSYEFGFLSHAERITIHAAHRIGAIVTALYIAWLALSVYRQANSFYFKNLSLAILVVLTVQVGLGISNIIFVLPLAVAVSHNLVAAVLLLSLITLVYGLKRKVQGVRFE
jgi:cytochrome c oxidase assembly protein subunit 15